MLPEQELPVQAVKLVWLHFKMRHPEMAKTCRIYVHVSATLFMFEFCTRFGERKENNLQTYVKSHRRRVRVPGSGGACRSSGGPFQTCWLSFSRSCYVTGDVLACAAPSESTVLSSH